MSNGIYGIGLSGLAAAQAGLDTPGYSRQLAIQGTRAPQFTGDGWFGTGVNVSTVRRVYSDFLGAQANRAGAGASQLDAYRTELGKLANLFGDPASGLAPALND